MSRAELRVLVLLAEGLSNEEIARRLGREVVTIEKHVRNVRRKLGVQAIPDLMAVARRRGMLP